MNPIYYFLIATIAFTEMSQATEYKKIYDNTAEKVVEVCSTDADGTMNVAIRCEYGLLDIPFISYRTDPKIKRKPTEMTEIITPVHTMRNKDSVYAIFNHALVEVNYGMADGRSSIIVYKPSGETPHKFSSGSGWFVATEALGTEVNEIEGFKKGDRFCLKKSPEGYPDGLPVIITRLFNRDHYAVVDTESKGFLGMGNTFSSHLTDLQNLVACTDKPSLDPNQMTKTSAPQSPVDVKVNDQLAPKEGTTPMAPPVDAEASTTEK